MKRGTPRTPVEPPDFAAAFGARLTWLLEALETHYREDRGQWIAVPQEEDLDARMRWSRAVLEARQGRAAMRGAWVCAPDGTAGVRLPLTVAEGLEIARAGVGADAREMAEQVAVASALLEEKARASILVRPVLSGIWPRLAPTRSASAFALHALATSCARLPDPELHLDPAFVHQEVGVGGLAYWSPKVAPEEVVAWFSAALNRLQPRSGDALLAQIKRGETPESIPVRDRDRVYTLPPGALAALYFAHMDVEEGRKRLSMAVDAGHRHNALLSGWRDNPHDGRRHRARSTKAGIVTADRVQYVDLLTNGHPIQLQLDIAALDNAHDSTIIAMRRLRGPEGLRNWAAMLKLFSVEGGRRGIYRWMMDEHLLALGYDERQRRDPDVQANIARMIEFFASLEIAVYGDDGRLRERRKMLIETGRFERLVESEWKLEGIEFQINPNLYSGVRAPGGEIGHNWMPAPVELAQIDHVRYPYAHGLGMLLAIRFRWRLNEQADDLSISGANLLKLAGITYESRRASEAWERIRRSLDVLVEVGQLQGYEWQGEPWSLDAICVIRSAYWITDRAARGLIPEEKPSDPSIPATGAELKKWREKNGLSQRELARRLGVTQGSISQIEAAPEKKMTAKMRSYFFSIKEKSKGDLPDPSSDPSTGSRSRAETSQHSVTHDE